ncbi:MAG TPA: HD domain-containing phosphohydrolase [Acidimicrobiales bacterium]|jgi:HD-GYP domain-containing protein (c-di-GMP phosphodiesterase class II)|nr:HD domain-containing phosphohydrolase [Acidimicrobiales bacterium]
MTPPTEPGDGPFAGRIPSGDPAALEAQLKVFAGEIGGLYRAQKERAEELEEALATLRRAYVETIRSFAFVVEAKDAYTGAHLERCRAYGVALMEALGVAAEHPDAEYGFLLHDAGKIGIPERILSKPGPLTAGEWRIMRTHPVIGYQMLENIPHMTTAAEIVRCHHEMFDGSGYPERLAGDEIPLAARAFSIVDAFDAMTTDRPYRQALGADHAAGELARMAGTQFDPDVVDVFLPLIGDLPDLVSGPA